MDCLNRKRLLAYADGDATPAEEAHLEACSHCQERMGEFTATFELALGRAAREPAYEGIEIDRAVAVIGGLGAAAGPVETGRHRPAGTTATLDDLPRDTTPAAPPEPPVDLSFLQPPQAPGELGRLGNYRVFGVLGQGGMGVVLRAEDVRLNRPIALKIMLPQRGGDRTAQERFLREARALALVRHERVVPVYEADEVEGVPYLAMPLLEGESLRSRLERTPGLSVAEAVRVAREAAEGLAAAHQCGLVHRDVKPANLWLELGADGWQVRVLDFGLARPQSGEALTRPGGVLGTPAYMSPEQARGDEVDGRGDLFSLGCVLYQMLTGVSAFAGRDVLAMLRRLELHEPEPPCKLNPAVPEALSAFVLRLLAKDREARPKTAREVAATLAALERGLPPTQPTTASFPLVAPSDTAPRAASTATQAPAPRRRWLWIGTGAAVLAGAVALVVLLPRWDAPSVPINPATKQVLPPLKGALDVLIYDPGNPRRQNIFLDEAGAMPLRPGDEFCIEAEVDRPAYLYVLWIDADGKVLPVYPWRPGHWEERPQEERPVAKLRRPAALDEFYQVSKGTAGMETLVLLARETPLPSNVDLRAELGALPRPAVQELKATAWFENGLPVRNRRGRVGMFDVTRRSDPVLATQQRIKERLLGRHFEYALAVSFANRGE